MRFNAGSDHALTSPDGCRSGGRQVSISFTVCCMPISPRPWAGPPQLTDESAPFRCAESHFAPYLSFWIEHSPHAPPEMSVEIEKGLPGRPNLRPLKSTCTRRSSS
jgi:hypothetical protein